jgi:uncharacterized RDD family membrane protein YckC
MGAIIRAMHEVSPPRPAGFWIRTLALAIDMIVFALVQVSLGALATLLAGPDVEMGGSPHASVPLFTLLFTAAYTTVLHVVAGQTIGKSLVGIRVIGLDGALLTVGPALLRYLACYLSAIPLGFGFLMAGLRRDKRALHDLIAGSRVERGPARRRVVRRPIAPRPGAGTLQDPAVRQAADPGPGA